MKRKKIIGTMAAILILLIVGAVAVVLVRRPFDAGKPDELLADYFACIEKGAYDKTSSYFRFNSSSSPYVLV